MGERIGLIGFGNMGSAIYERAKDAFDISVYEKDTAKTQGLEKTKVAQDIAALAEQADALLLAVKPQDFPSLFEKIAGTRAVVISIAAGIRTQNIEKALTKARVVRVMPNLAARAGKAMSCIAKGSSASDNEARLAERLFKKVGQVLVIDERMMDAATAISGSGPGFFFEMAIGKSVHEARNFAKHMFVPELSAAAVQLGFTPQQASLLARATAEGALALIEEGICPVQELRDRVCSKGGTTEAGLAALRQTGSLADAAKAALKRAGELAA